MWFIQTLVTNRLDCCGMLCMKLPANITLKLQLAQNGAAQVLTRTRQFDCIPLLYQLHWVTVHFPVQFRVLLPFKPSLFKAQQPEGMPLSYATTCPLRPAVGSPCR